MNGFRVQSLGFRAILWTRSCTIPYSSDSQSRTLRVGKPDMVGRPKP